MYEPPRSAFGASPQGAPLADRRSRIPGGCLKAFRFTPAPPMPTSAFNLRLRPTMLSDLDFVISVEQDPANLPFITPWDRTQHEGAIRFPDFRHFIVEAGSGYPLAGFVILQGCRNPHRSIELKRIVLRAELHGRGHGRTAIRLLAQMAFRDLGAHRFWLDVKARNLRAQALYRSEGFVEEGRLRESVKTGDGYDSLVVMSMLEVEHRARIDAGAAPAGSAPRR
jgi:diamine N-acetyltransferase